MGSHCCSGRMPGFMANASRRLPPNLVAVVPNRRRNSTTVAAAITSQRCLRDIRAALMVPVLAQYLLLCEHLLGVATQEDAPYCFIWCWSSSGAYTARLTYKVLFMGQTGLHSAKELWKVKAPNNCHFFMWLILHGRCWTLSGFKGTGCRTMDRVLSIPRKRKPLITCFCSVS
jgi:hypothetical protein